MTLTPAEIQWIANEYLLGRTVDEINVDTGISHSQIRRALAEANLLKLSWYKTKEENKILSYLSTMNIHTLEQLKETM